MASGGPDSFSANSSCIIIFYDKSLSLAFSNFHFSPRYNNHDSKPLSRKTQGLFLCLEVSILLFRTITIIITIVF